MKVALGSSPLTRGKPPLYSTVTARRRLIPAHAGKTGPRRDRVDRAGAHPRSRGENRPASAGLSPRRGSSPLTRGKHLIVAHEATFTGLIPAHAGKTRRRRYRRGHGGAHPRSRGENLAWAVEGARAYGSSPLTRGKHRQKRVDALATRLIPAHAGKTFVEVATTAPGAAHPRSRGENVAAFLGDRMRRGSSPLTRGKPRSSVRNGVSWGLIPAHAGKTKQPYDSERHHEAHPRSRGENPRIRRWSVRCWGSSPLTRGKPTAANSEPGGQWLIPAHAGKTSTSRGSAPPKRAHPRSRGENRAADVLDETPGGSSPLTRGKRLR